jgi:P2 family phage contractile tail tube protein
MATRVPTVIRNFSLRRIGSPTIYLGAADLELPTFTALTMELSGSGLLGKSDVSIPGHFSNLSVKISLHTPDSEFIGFYDVDGDIIEARGLIQGKDPASGKRYTDALRVAMRCDGVKTATPGKLTVGEKSDSNVDMTVDQVTYYLNESKVLEWDFYAYKFTVNGKDILAADKSLLGFA